MSFTTLNFTSGQPLSEAELDTLVANDVHVRAETEFKLVASGGGTHVGVVQADRWQILIDGAAITSWAALGDGSTLNYDLAAYADGQHTLGVVFGRTSGGATVKIFTYRFVKSADMDRLSVWLTAAVTEFGSDALFLSSLSNLTAIGHMTNVTWTV